MYGWQQERGAAGLKLVLILAGLGAVFGALFALTARPFLPAQQAPLAKLDAAMEEIYFLEADLQTLATEAAAAAAGVLGGPVRTDAALTVEHLRPVQQWVENEGAKAWEDQAPGIAAIGSRLGEPVEEAIAGLRTVKQSQPTGRPELSAIVYDTEAAFADWLDRYRNAMEAFTAEAFRELLDESKPHLGTYILQDDVQKLMREDTEGGRALALLEERDYFVKQYVGEIAKMLGEGKREAALEAAAERRMLGQTEAHLDQFVEEIVPHDLDMVKAFQQDRMEKLGQCLAALNDEILPSIAKARNVLADMRVEIEDAQGKHRRALSQAQQNQSLENQIWIVVGGGGALLIIFAAGWLPSKPERKPVDAK